MNYDNMQKHRRTQGGHGDTPPHLWPCNKVLKLNFQYILSHIGCSLLSLILAKLLLVDISCENVFALSIVTALPAYPFFTRKSAKMSVFYGKIVKICWRVGA